MYLKIKSFFNIEAWNFSVNVSLYYFVVFFLYVILLMNYSCNSCHGGLGVNNSELVTIAETEFDDNIDDEHLKTVNKKTADNNSISEISLMKELEKKDLESFNLLKNFASLMQQDDEDIAENYNTYWKVIEVARERKSLKDGWFNYNIDMQKGFETGNSLGVVSNRENFFAKHSNMLNVIDRIISFESFFKYKNEQFLSGELDPSEFIDSLDDFANYFVSMIMLKNMLETKRSNGSLRYVEDTTNSVKPRIPAVIANRLIDKINKLIYRVETFQVTSRKELSMLATPTNLVSCKPRLERLHNLIGGSIDPESHDPNELSLVYKRNITPGSALWCWINSKSLRNGSWNSSIRRPSKESSIVKLLYDLNILNSEYIKIIDQMQAILTNCSHKEADKKLLELFLKAKQDSRFIRIHENGKRAINLIREIMTKTESYDIGRPGGKTLGLKYVGNWRKDDNSKQILETDGRQLVDCLDILSGIAVLIDSDLAMKTSLFYSQIVRQAIRSVSKNPKSADCLWTMESVEEQDKRESQKRSSLSKWLGLVLVLTGITALFPPLLPITLCLLGVKVAIAIALFNT